MSFSLFFTITGILFVVLASIIIKNVYDYYPINKITEFFHPMEETIFNKISISFIPILIWAIIECPVLGYNDLFLLGLLLNLVINFSINYIINYGSLLIFSEEKKIISVIAIILASIIGLLINYLTLFIGSFDEMTNSIIGLILLIVLFVLIRLLKPNVLIFKNQKK